MTDFHICDWAIICCCWLMILKLALLFKNVIDVCDWVFISFCWLMILKLNMLFTLLFKSVIDVCISRILLVSIVEPSVVCLSDAKMFSTYSPMFCIEINDSAHEIKNCIP